MEHRAHNIRHASPTIYHVSRPFASFHSTAHHITSHHNESNRIASHRIASHRIASHRFAPHLTSPQRTSPHHTTPTTPHHTPSHHITSHRIASHRIASYGTTSCNRILSYHTISYHASDTSSSSTQTCMYPNLNSERSLAPGSPQHPVRRTLVPAAKIPGNEKWRLPQQVGGGRVPTREPKEDAQERGLMKRLPGFMVPRAPKNFGQSCMRSHVTVTLR